MTPHGLSIRASLHPVIVGEGAPGADGSRRWRGRRGRRRGRGPGQRDESSQTVSAQPISPLVDSAYEGPTGDSQYDESFDIDGAAAAPPRIDTAPIASAYPSDTTGSSSENTGRNNRDDKGRRNK